MVAEALTDLERYTMAYVYPICVMAGSCFARPRPCVHNCRLAAASYGAEDSSTWLNYFCADAHVAKAVTRQQIYGAEFSCLSYRYLGGQPGD